MAHIDTVEGQRQMFSKLSRSRSPKRHAGQKRSAPKVETKSSGVAGKSAREATVLKPPVADKEASHHSPPREGARSHDFLSKNVELSDQATNPEVGEEVRKVNVISHS